MAPKANESQMFTIGHLDYQSVIFWDKSSNLNFMTKYVNHSKLNDLSFTNKTWISGENKIGLENWRTPVVQDLLSTGL